MVMILGLSIALFAGLVWFACRSVAALTLVQCDSCHAYTPGHQIRWYAGAPVCRRCEQAMEEDQ